MSTVDDGVGAATGTASTVDEGMERLVATIGGQARPGQVQMAHAVASAMAERRHLLVQAGTGTGKSFAYLVPAVQHSVSAGGRVVVATATLALQRQLITKDIPAVSEALGPLLPRAVRIALLKGRSNYVCLLRLDGAAAAATNAEEPLFEVPSRLEQQAETVRLWARRTETGDRDDLPAPVDARVWRALSVTGHECVGRQRCPVGADCFAEAARDVAAEADLVITNHALLAIDLAGDAAALPEYRVAIIDEAHEFAARLTGASTQTLSEPVVDEAVRLARPHLSSTGAETLADAGLRYAAQLRLELPAAKEPLLPDLSEALVRSLAVLRDAAHAAAGELAGQGDEADLARRQAATAAITAIHDRAGLLLGDDPRMVRWGSSDPAGLTCAPLSVADLISDSLMEGRTIIATSATLQVGGSFDALAADWGLQQGDGASWSHMDVGSPFDYQRQGILYLPRDLPLPGQEAVSDAALARIGALVRAAGGRALILASAWRGVDAIASYLLDAQIPGVELLVQQRGSPPGPLVEAFGERPESVLVGTLSLWQGVDVPGPSCSLVVIDKIPFPRPDEPVLAARAAAAAAGGRSGFAAVSLPHAGLLLAQGAGRLIRTPTDRGVVAILDARLSHRGYRKYLLQSLPPMWRSSETDVVLGALRRLKG